MQKDAHPADTTPDPEIVTIDPHALYRPDYLRRVLGVRCVNHLTQAGLRALGGWYSGHAILEAFERARQHEHRQCVPGKEIEIETEHEDGAREKNEQPVVTGAVKRERKVQPLSAPKRPDTLVGQMEELERGLA